MQLSSLDSQLATRDLPPQGVASRLLIATQHPGLGGGVLSLVRAFLGWVGQTRGLSPALAYAPLSATDPVNATLGRVLCGRWRPGRRDEAWQGVPAHCLGKLLPRVEALTGRGNAMVWERLLDGFELAQVICGYAVTGVPVAQSGKRYVAWVATSMEGDKRARLAGGGKAELCHHMRRLAHRVQYRELLRLERMVLERASWVLAISPYTRDELRERGAPADRTTCLPPPVDVERFHPAEDGAKQGFAPTVLSAGRPNDPRKNTSLLLRAFARIAPSVPDARLTLVGEGDAAEFGSLRQLANQLGVGAKLSFAANCAETDLPEIYRKATVFAIPSDQEGLCIAGLEAMASGLPVVSTRCGGPESFVLPEKTGLLVERHDERQFADALHHLLTDHAAAARIGRQARALMEQEYSPATFARQMRRVYATVWPDVVGALEGWRQS
jgi:glycosyltransferase involved in cell wall biosynthesis